MRNLFISVVASVVVAWLTCNPAAASEDESSVTDHLHLGGYASVDAQTHKGDHATARLHELSLFLVWDAGGRLRLFSEIELEKPLIWEEGGSINSKDAYLDIERLYVDYDVTGALTARGGRFLTPIGRWNVVHAAPLVWTTNRPAATERLFPMGINGAMAYGTLPTGEGSFDYALFGEMVRDQTNENNEPYFKNTRGLRLAYNGIAEVGVTLTEFEEDTINHPRYRMVGLDFSKSVDGWEFSGEAYRRFKRNGSEDKSGGGYLQAVAPLGNRWYAVARVENLRLPETGNDGRWLVGAAWRWRTNQIFKLEYAGGRDSNPYMPRGVAASWAILF
ncbi:MAG: hypothetical protein LBE24_00415 [Methylobacillus sp.]|jgi:hypothetical protein|nr:hypothetical protein [Methylobacillus sp.]